MRKVIILLVLLIVGCSSSSDDSEPPKPIIITEDDDVVLPHTDWTLYNQNPIIDPINGTTNWDSEIIMTPMVVKYKDTIRMWYSGSNSSQDGLLHNAIHIGYAWSLNGLTWQKNPEPVLMPRSGEWDYPQVYGPKVIVDNDKFHMWFGGGDITTDGVKIGYATSSDGIHWIRETDPVITPNNKPWNKDGVLPGPVLKEGNIFKMWFLGGEGPFGYPNENTSWSTGYATSSDGINWTLLDEPVLKVSLDAIYFDFNTASAGTVLKTSENVYEMWYTGLRKRPFETSSDIKIGYATSSDGISWVKYGYNPVLESTSESAQSYGTEFLSPNVIVEGNEYHMWFEVWHPGISICYATASNN